MNQNTCPHLASPETVVHVPRDRVAGKVVLVSWFFIGSLYSKYLLYYTTRGMTAFRGVQ
jgi:hypothetical protein